jgi:hypothetical protein
MANFKQYQRNQRSVATEQDFRGGMKYTNIPITDGFWKTIVNYDLDPTGSSIHPRPGFKLFSQAILPGGNWLIHHSGIITAVRNQFEDYSIRYTLVYDQEQRRLIMVDDYNAPDLTPREIVSEYFPRINVYNTGESLHGMAYGGSDEGPQPWAFLGGSVFFPSEDGILQLKATVNQDGLAYDISKVEPRVMSPSEAVGLGYNMLSDNPYAMGDTPIGAFDLTGIIVQDQAGNTLLQGKENTTVVFKALTQGTIPTSGKFTWKFQDLENSEKVFYKITPGREVTQMIEYKKLSVSVIYTDSSDNPLATCSLALYRFTEDNNNFQMIPYPVANAKHMTVWQQRLVVWGVPQGRNVLFVSQVGAANYFPYPHNSDIFTGDIVACVPFLKDLLVFTTHQLHRLSILPAGGYKSEVIQDNLYMSEIDLSTVHTVQNMIFFKSGNYYYMVVPRTNSGEQGALQLAPISTNITELLNEMYPLVRETLIRLYGDKTQEIPALHKFNVLKDNAVLRCVYKFRLRDKFIDGILNYSTVLRTWTLYTVQSTSKNLNVRRADVTTRTEYATIDGVTFKTMRTQPLDIVDDFIPTTFHNLQLLDTGYRELNSQFKKRFREIQFKINNVSKKSLLFGNEFRIDEYTRKHLHKYSVQIEEDYIKVVPDFDNVIVSSGETILDEVETNLYIQEVDYTLEDSVVQLITNAWQLDVSSMSDVSMKKVRIGVSGKGYAPRFILVSLNKEFYELTNFNWVYRTMNAR